MSSCGFYHYDFQRSGWIHHFLIIASWEFSEFMRSNHLPHVFFAVCWSLKINAGFSSGSSTFKSPLPPFLFTLNSLDRHERQNLYLVFLQLYGPLSVNSHKCYRLIYRRQDLKSPCGENQAFNVVLCLNGVFNMTNHIQIHKYVFLKVPVKSKLSMCSEFVTPQKNV